MPRDVSAKFLEHYSKPDWNEAPLMTHCKRAEVESGAVKLIQTGDGTVHPIEAEYLRPELHTPMSLQRPVVHTSELDRFILQVAESLGELRGAYIAKYLRYGERTPFASKKSKAVPVSERSSCKSRNPWYDLTGQKPGCFLWPMIQQYRHIIPANPDGVICNKRLFPVYPIDLTKDQTTALQAIVNSTFVALFKFFYGRFAGTEGAMDTDVIDVNLLEIPDPRHATKSVVKKLQDAFAKLCKRDARPMVEEQFMACHSAERAKKLAEKPIGLPTELQMEDRRALDLAVFELLGVADAKERETLCDELYHETAAHFRQIRVVEIQKQEQRARSEGREFRTDELSADLWDALTEAEKQPLAEWFASQTSGGKTFTIPEGHSSLPDANDFLDANTVFFRLGAGGKAKSQPMPTPSRSHAEIIYTLSQRSLHGAIRLPEKESAARELKRLLDARLAAIADKANHLARSRTSDERKAADLAGLLQHWMIHGKPQKRAEESESTKRAEGGMGGQHA
jgi:hypothetical protein